MPQLFVFLGALSRLLPHPANFTPVAALALFGGTHLSTRKAISTVLLALLVSDVGLHFLLGYPIFTAVTPFVYAATALIVLVGRWYQKMKNAGRFAASVLFSSTLFFIISNFGTWLFGNLYPRTAAGLAECFTLAIPFFQTSLAGDFAWSFVLFGAYAWISRTSRAPSQVNVQTA